MGEAFERRLNTDVYSRILTKMSRYLCNRYERGQEMTTTQKIGFIGLGVMGEPMCRNLAQKMGQQVTAYDTQAAPLARLGATVTPAQSVAQVMQASDIVFLSLPSGEIVAEVARNADGLLAHARAGQTIVDLSTSPVNLTRALFEEFKARGVTLIDAPVARTRAAAEAGTLSVMVGATPEQFAMVKPLIACFASEITLCGGVGAGQITKILNNMVLFETVVALAEARAIARRSGVDPKALFETLSLGSADSFALRNHGMKAMIPGDFPERAFSVDYAAKDLRYALELAEETGVDAAGARNVQRLYELATTRGDKEAYHPVISRVVDPQ
jgi:3-hydroxyisobutyrate dehydrogenase-like beta-hydroxyacid dehydrogenase